MFSEIPYTFWMVVITVVTFFFCMILYYFAMLLRESTGAVGEMRETIKRANTILDETKEVVVMAKDTMRSVQNAVTEIGESARSTVQDINNSVVAPAKKIGGTINMVSGFVSGFLGKEEASEE